VLDFNYTVGSIYVRRYMFYHDLNDGEFDLTMYVPTKGRPQQAFDLETQFYKTIALNSRIKFILSDNDPKLPDYMQLPWVDTPIIVRPSKPGFVDPLNLGYLKDRREIYSFAVGFMGDDHYPLTPHWDQRFVETLLDMKAGLVYGNDGLQGKNIPTQIAMTADIPLALGFMTLPQLWHLYADKFWLDLGEGLNRIKYLPDVYLEHRHPAIGKAKSDAGYEFSGSSTLDSRDRALYEEYLHDDLENDIKKVMGMIRRTGK
jgi:hypothetical protein